jgi:hypothetical protein
MAFPSFVARTARLVTLLFGSTLLLTACQTDGIAGTDPACSDLPGCAPIAATAAPEVLDALADVTARVVASLDQAARAPLDAPLARLQRAVVKRDIADGRFALAAANDVIAQLERADSEARPDLGAIRLSLVPAALSLGLSPSTIIDPSP